MEELAKTRVSSLGRIVDRDMYFDGLGLHLLLTAVLGRMGAGQSC